MLLLAADFYYLKNIAGRRLVGLRWWNEVDTGTGDSHWVFESQDRSSGGTDERGRDRPVQNMTDKRFFWLALYCQPGLWIVLGVLAIIRFKNPIWLILIGELRLSFLLLVVGERFFGVSGRRTLWLGYAFGGVTGGDFPEALLITLIAIALTLTITNTLAFSRCDKFSQASNLASSAFYSGNLARNVAGGLFSRMFNRG